LYRRNWVSGIAVELRSIRFFGVDEKSSGGALLLINPTQAGRLSSVYRLNPATHRLACMIVCTLWLRG